MASKASSSLLIASKRAHNCHSTNWRLQYPRRKVASSALLEDASPPPSPKASKANYRVRTAVLLNRSPTLTRPPTPFEAAHYEYNARIARALFNPFPVEFYFKAGSILENQFMREESRREMEAFRWKRHTRKNLESKESEDDANSNDMGVGVLVKEEEETVMPRVSEADRKGDVKSLDRKGHRNLFLLVKKGKGRNEWRLPGGVREIQDGELLHEAAKRELHAECGVNLDAWIVGRHPIGYMNDQIPPESPLSEAVQGAKTFFFKGHILAGQVEPSAGSLADFAWLTKREIKRAVTPEYWTNIRDILSDF